MDILRLLALQVKCTAPLAKSTKHVVHTHQLNDRFLLPFQHSHTSVRARATRMMCGERARAEATRREDYFFFTFPPSRKPSPQILRLTLNALLPADVPRYEESGNLNIQCWHSAGLALGQRGHSLAGRARSRTFSPFHLIGRNLPLTSWVNNNL